MLDKVQLILSARFPTEVVKDLLGSYGEVLKHYHTSDWRSCLNCAGIFVENVFRMLIALRDGTAPEEVKSVDAERKNLETSTVLSETARILIPRVAWAMIYDKRSRKGGAHVKRCSPEYLDAHLCVHSSNWILAELLREYGSQDEESVNLVIVQMMREHVPYVDVFGEEKFVTVPMPAALEILLQLHESEPAGMDRRQLGKCVKASPSALSMALGRLETNRYVFKSPECRYRITSSGRQYLKEGLPCP
jgi:hypothetical protein